MEEINKKMDNLSMKNDDSMDIIKDTQDQIIDKKDAMDIIKNTTDDKDVMEIVSNYNEKLWNTITDFITVLKDNFGSEFHEIKLYNLLLENTGLIHVEQKEKHINLFRDYVLQNQLAILEQNINDLGEEMIVYSSKIFINVKQIIVKATKEDQESIWEYLLLILALASPDSKAQNILTTRQREARSNPVHEENIFSDLFKTITTQLENTDLNETNPMSMIGSLMNNDVVNNLFNSMGNMDGGEFDINKILESFQSVIQNVQNQGSSGNSSS
jgi:hypothetical protein